MHYEETRCEHKNFDLVKVEVRGGAIQIRKQCQDCFTTFGGAVAKDAIKVDIESIPFADLARAEEYEQNRIKEAKERRKKEKEEQAAEREKRVAEYQSYLLTDKWRKKRSLVLKRANYICEGCGEKQANEVHHLTYDHVGTVCEEGELLFELVALCSECHRRAHGK